MLKTTKKQNTPGQYPKLRQADGGPNHGMVALFTTPAEGTVMWVPKQAAIGFYPGYHATDWDPDQFADFHGSILLEEV